MAISKEAYQALESAVGKEYISQDPMICQAYHPQRGAGGTDMAFGRVISKSPVCVVLPKSTEEVQKIVKICYRYKIPFTPASSYWIIHSGPRHPEALMVDLKRMNKLEINTKNMYAIVEPAVIYSQLQEQIMRKGFYTTVPGGGAQVSVLANHINFAWSPLNYRNGLPHRRILGVEWILPNGELLRLGSLAMGGEDYFWGEGPGPDLRGILRGYLGWFGANGVITRIAVKIFPFQPERLEPIGISQYSTLALPTNRVKWYNFTMPSSEKMAEAMHKLGEAEIGAAATKVPIFWRYLSRARTKEHFWEMWAAPGKEEEIANTHILRVMLIGYASEKQLEYEERVLMDIAAECGGELRRTRQTDESWLKNADSADMWFMTGGYMSVIGSIDTMNHALRSGPAYAEEKAKYTPPLMPDYGDPGWFQVSEIGHMGYFEFLTYFDPHDSDEAWETIDEWYFIAVPKLDIRKGIYNGFQLCLTPFSLTAPSLGPNSDKWLLKVKDMLDPDWISNPPSPIDVDEAIERTPYLKAKRDWPLIRKVLPE
jgi:hypothetical protein